MRVLLAAIAGLVAGLLAPGSAHRALVGFLRSAGETFGQLAAGVAEAIPGMGLAGVSVVTALAAVCALPTLLMLVVEAAAAGRGPRTAGTAVLLGVAAVTWWAGMSWALAVLLVVLAAGLAALPGLWGRVPLALGFLLIAGTWVRETLAGGTLLGQWAVLLAEQIGWSAAAWALLLGTLTCAVFAAGGRFAVRQRHTE